MEFAVWKKLEGFYAEERDDSRAVSIMRGVRPKVIEVDTGICCGR